MIDELEVIKTIISELSGASLWFGLAYVAYLLFTKVSVVVGVAYTIKYACDKLFKLLEPGITKAEADRIRAESEKARADSYATEQKLRAEVDMVKHKYKMMTEVKKDGSA